MRRRSRCETLISISLAFLFGIRAARDCLEQVGVEHQRLEVVADGVHMHVLVDELDGLGAERVPKQPAVTGGGLDRLVDLRQPAVVGLELAEHRVG